MVASTIVRDKDDASGLRRLPSATRGTGRGGLRRRGNTDTVKLLMLGYRQELEREFTLFNCFGSSFTALSSLTALGGTYYIGLVYGGPVVMMWGWLVVTFFTASVGLSMAELASAYPTSGALYYWSYKLAPRRMRNLACWMTAWILTMGQAAFSASNFYTFVHLVSAAVLVQYGVVISEVQQFAILVGMLTIIGLLNCGSARLTAFMTTLGTLWHIVALAAFCVTVPLIAPARQSIKYVFTSWQPNYDISGISSPVYITLVGLLMAQWTLTGYDGSAHLAEETLHAEVNVPRAIMLTIAGVGITGYAFILALTFVRIDPGVLLNKDNETGGSNVVLQILIEVTKEVYGSVSGGVALFTIPIVGTFFCSYQTIANNSRMLYAFARDNGVPLASYAKQVHPITKVPVYGVLYMLFLTSLLATPMCFNIYVFPAVTSFAVVGCYIAYALPVLCKLSAGRRNFLPGPFFLGFRLSYYNNVVSLLWVLTVTVLFILPQYYPISLINMNWSAPILGMALAFSLGWYFLPYKGARTWFIGPRANLGQFQDVLPSEVARMDESKRPARPEAEVQVEAAAWGPEVKADPAALAEVDSVLNRMASCTGGGGGAGGILGGGGNVGSFVRRLSHLSGAKSTRSGSVTASGYVNAAATMTASRYVNAAATSGSVTASGYINAVAAAAGSDEGEVVAAAVAVRSPSFAARTLGLEAQATSSIGFHRSHSQGQSHPANTLSDSFALQSQRSNLGSPVRGAMPAFSASATASATATASKARRQSALSLLDGSLSCASHIALLLQGSSLLDNTEVQDDEPGGCREGRDGRTSLLAEAASRPLRDRDRVRHGSVCSPQSPGMLEAWIGGGRRSHGLVGVGGSSGGGGVAHPPERTSAQLGQDRASPLIPVTLRGGIQARQVTGAAAAAGAGPQGDGGGSGAPMEAATSADGFIPALSHNGGAVGCSGTGAGVGSCSGGACSGDGQLHRSDSGIVRAARARLRRASLSVMALLPHRFAASGGPAAAPTQTPIPVPRLGHGVRPGAAASANGMVPAPLLYGTMPGNQQRAAPRLSLQPRARRSSVGIMVIDAVAAVADGSCDGSGSGDAVLYRSVPLALQHRIVPSGYSNLHFVMSTEEDDGARLSADRGARLNRVRRASVCARVVLDGPQASPRTTAAGAADAAAVEAGATDSGRGREVGDEGRRSNLHAGRG